MYIRNNYSISVVNVISFMQYNSALLEYSLRSVIVIKGPTEAMIIIRYSGA